MASQLFNVVLLLCIASACLATEVTITGIHPTSLSTTQCTPVTITGTGFDTISITGVTFSGIACGSLTVEGCNDITCVAEPGLGQDTQVTIHGTEDSYSAWIVDYTAATIQPCSGDAASTEIMVDPSNLPTVTICGTNFGEYQHTNGDSDYTGRFEVEVAGFKGTLHHHSDCRIIATLPDAAGVQQKIKVVLGSQVLVVPNTVATYPAPQVTNIKNDANSKRATGVRVGVYGRNFGVPSPLIHLTVTIGAFPCVSINHVSDSELHCTVSGYGANRAVVVTVNGQSSALPGSTGAPSVRYDFPDPTTPGLDCTPPYGAADAINPELCNCWAGSAPSSNLYSDCDVHAICPGRITSPTVVSQYPPARPTTQFKDDKLWITQTMPIVKNRRDTIIQFVAPAIASVSPATAPGTIGASTCFYPGNIWTKTVNELDCVDTYHGVLEWSQNVLCGFVEDLTQISATTIFYKTSLVTTYTETFKANDGTLTFRKVSNAFLLTVSFKRQVVALTQTDVTVYIQDPTVQGNLDVAVVGDALYDVASKNTLISFETTIVWPYQLASATLVGTWKKAAGNADPGKVVATATLSAVQPGELECDSVQDTTCGQSWMLTIQTQPDNAVLPTCNLQGLIEFSTGNLLCRDEETVFVCPGNPNTNFTISIGATDLCDGSHDVDASAGLTHILEPYYDSAYTVPQSTFQTGDMVYFKLVVNDPTSTIDAITFNEIDLNNADLSLTDLLYQVQTAGDLPTAPTTTIKTAAEVNVTYEIRQPTDFIAPGNDAVLTFQFRLLRNHLTTISSLSTDNPDDITKQLTVSATIDLWYHGNQKRTVVAAGSLPSVSHSQISFYNMPDTEEELENNIAIEEADQAMELSLFASPASTVVASFAAVAVAVAVLLA